MKNPFIREVEVDVIEKMINEIFKAGFELHVFHNKMFNNWDISISKKTKNVTMDYSEEGKSLTKVIKKLHNYV